MRSMFTRWPILLLCLFTFMPALADEAPAISDAWIAEAPPGVGVLVGYFTLHNLGASQLTLTGIQSDDFNMVMMHKSIVENGMARMEHQSSVSVPAGGSVRFEQGGLHLMLMGPKRSLRAGGSVVLEFSLADGSRLQQAFPVRRR